MEVKHEYFKYSYSNEIKKVRIDGSIKDIWQLDKTHFKMIPKRWEIMKNTIYNESILFCWN